MVKGILYTEEKINEDIKFYREAVEKHKKDYPGCETLNKELGYDLRHNQYLHARAIESYLTSMLCNFDYKASEVEVVKEAVFK
jgi:hypothetical protein